MPAINLTAIVDPLLTFRLIIEQELVKYRHQYVHSVVTIDRDALDIFVARWGPNPLEPGAGGWILLALAEAIVAAIPPGSRTALPDPDAFFADVQAIPNELAKAIRLGPHFQKLPWLDKTSVSVQVSWLSLAQDQYDKECRVCQDKVRKLVEETREEQTHYLRSLSPLLNVRSQRKLDALLPRLGATELPDDVLGVLAQQYLVGEPGEAQATNWMVSALIKECEPDWLSAPEKTQAWNTWWNKNRPEVHAGALAQLLG